MKIPARAGGVPARRLATGDVWSFTVADRLVIEDFEAYDLKAHFLYETWQPRGWAGVSIEQGIVASCRQSMSFHYHYDATWFSEVARVFERPQDWAHAEAQVLQILLRGTAGNGTRGGQMYVTLSDGQAEQTVPYAGDLSILADPRWSVWRIALADFDKIDLAHVTEHSHRAAFRHGESAGPRHRHDLPRRYHPASGVVPPEPRLDRTRRKPVPGGSDR